MAEKLYCYDFSLSVPTAGRSVVSGEECSLDVTGWDSGHIEGALHRRWVHFVNAGVNNVFLHLDQAAADNTGIGPIVPNGSFLLNMKEIEWYGAIHAIALTAPCQVNIIEVTDNPQKGS